MSGGSPGSTEIRQTPGTRDPGYSFARDFFNSLGGIAQNPYPSYQGNLDPGLSPTMQNALRMVQGYAGSGPPEILGGVSGSLGRFMSPNFQNPMARVGLGFPAYFGISPTQRMYGGGTIADLGKGDGMTLPPGDAGGWASLLNIDPASQVAMDLQNIFSGGGAQPGMVGGMPTPPWAPGQPGYGTGPTYAGQPGYGTGPTYAGQPGYGTGPTYANPQPNGGSSPPLAPNGAGGATPTLPAVLPQASPYSAAPQVEQWLKEAGGGPVTYDANGMPVYSQRMAGAKTAWNMGGGANRGELRKNPATGQLEILMGTGAGGESYGWQPFDPNNFGHVQNAAMFQRYGANWTAGGRGAGGHSTDVAAELEAQLGRKPTVFEIQDAMYGVGRPFSYSTVPTPTPATPGTPPPTPGTPAPNQPGTPPPSAGNITIPAPPQTPGAGAPRPRNPPGPGTATPGAGGTRPGGPSLPGATKPMPGVTTPPPTTTSPLKGPTPPAPGTYQVAPNVTNKPVRYGWGAWG